MWYAEHVPRKPRNSPNPAGRPPKVREAAAALAHAERTGVSLAEAAAAHGVSDRTVSKLKAARAKGDTSPTVAPPSTAPALPQGGSSTSTRPDLLELLRRIGRARNGAAWAEVEQGLEVHQRGGEEALAPWLLRPVEATTLGVDELDALSGALDLAVELAGRAEPGGAALRALREVSSLGKSVATVRAKRPAEPKPDAVQEAVRGEMDAAVAQLLRHTREAAATFERGRRALLDGLDLGPSTAAEITRRLDALLEGRPS